MPQHNRLLMKRPFDFGAIRHAIYSSSHFPTASAAVFLLRPPPRRLFPFFPVRSPPPARACFRHAPACRAPSETSCAPATRPEAWMNPRDHNSHPSCRYSAWYGLRVLRWECYNMFLPMVFLAGEASSNNRAGERSEPKFALPARGEASNKETKHPH